MQNDEADYRLFHLFFRTTSKVLAVLESRLCETSATKIRKNTKTDKKCEKNADDKIKRKEKKIKIRPKRLTMRVS